MANSTPGPIAYLAPEIPALSATFVYEEIFGLERRGIKVIPVSVRRPSTMAFGQDELAERVSYLYEDSNLELLFSLAHCFISQPRLTVNALWLLSYDIVRSNPFKIRSWKLLYQFFTGCKLARILMTHGCMHLHIHFAHVPTQIGMYASAISNTPFTFVAHANDIFERGFMLEQKAKRAAQLITISDYNRSYLVKHGIPHDRIAIVRCGVSVVSTTRRPNFAHKAVYRVGTLGRLVEKKGIDTFIKSIYLLDNKSFSLEVEICGDGPLKGQLERLVQDCGLGESVRFPGNLAHNEVAGWLGGLDLFVLACKTDSNGDMDGIPVVLMEAMSQGIPVVSSRISGVPELVIHENTGLLAEPDNADDLAIQIARALADPEMRQNLACNALKYVELEFSMNTNLDRLEQYLSPPLHPNKH